MIAVQSSVSVEMLRLCLVGIFTILFAGGVNSSNSARNITVDEGSSYTLFVVTDRHNVKTCHLTPPQNKKIEFKPNDVTATTAKYEIMDMGWECMITLHKIDINDEGIWLMSYDHTGEDDANTESVNLIVNVAGPTENKENEEDEENEDEDENVTFLSVVHHFTRREMEIDISLDKKTFKEECYVRPPNGVLTKADNFKMDHVTVQESSNFVSCRITLGPMSDSLLGTWRLCGKSLQNQEMRCQPANIVWNNVANPNANWQLTTQTQFSHPVHYGGSVNPGVVGNGPVETCHVVTPNGEDLVITSDVTYPHIERIAFDHPTLCSINFTNIDGFSIGEWIIYGKFRAWTGGLNEMRLPLRFFLYDEKHPYEQAYNVTTLPENRHLVILGRTLEVSVTSLIGQVDNCQYTMPTGQSYDLNNVVTTNGVVLKSVDTTLACRITLNPITKDMLGQWQLIGKFSNGNLFTERRQSFYIIQEDPANPIIDDFRVVENLSSVIFDSELGASHTVTIATLQFVENESCHLMTQNGLQYAFIDGFNIPNVEIVEGNGIECGVKVNVSSLDMLGEWTLIARGTRSSTNPIERRRSFTIRIEEISSLGNAITITEGADLYLSLPNATYMYDTCKLYGPSDEEVTDFEVDQFRYSSCGYIVRNVTRTQRGTWTIVYGNQITYRATVEVNILESIEIAVEDLVWTAGSSVNVTIGPEDAVYCRLIDNQHNSVYDGFGQCRIVLDSVKIAQKGEWRISVGIPGTVMLRHDSFNVNVLPADFRPVVTTDVVRNGSSVILTCSVPGENEVQACLFRDPTHNILIASHGVGQDGYTGAHILYESDSDSHNCTLRVLTPSSQHLGVWRCAVDTARHTSYGFLTLTGSMADETSSYYYSEPELSSEASVFGGAEGDAVTMSCSIDAVIRYCYYRAPNGTIFNVGPSLSSADYEYVGNGLDSGECGIRFNHLLRNDTGDWSCNVGLVGKSEELRRSFEVSVYERMSMYHGWQGSSVILRLSLGDAPELEYCRFVRIDGLGFTSDNVPSEYILDSYELKSGACALAIPSPISDDLCPWTVFAKAIGKEEELFMTSTFMLPSPLMSQLLVIPVLLWTLFGFMCVLLILAVVSLIPKKNREWTYQRASHIRNSFKKQPQPVHTEMLY